MSSFFFLREETQQTVEDLNIWKLLSCISHKQSDQIIRCETFQQDQWKLTEKKHTRKTHAKSDYNAGFAINFFFPPRLDLTLCMRYLCFQKSKIGREFFWNTSKKKILDLKWRRPVIEAHWWSTFSNPVYLRQDMKPKKTKKLEFGLKLFSCSHKLGLGWSFSVSIADMKKILLILNTFNVLTGRFCLCDVILYKCTRL